MKDPYHTQNNIADRPEGVVSNQTEPGEEYRLEIRAEHLGHHVIDHPFKAGCLLNGHALRLRTVLIFTMMHAAHAKYFAKVQSNTLAPGPPLG